MQASLDDVHTLFEQSSDLVQVIALDDTLIYTNLTWQRVLGYASGLTPVERTVRDIPTSFLQVLHVDDRDRYQQACTHLQTHGGTYTLSLRLLAQNGAAIPVTGQVCIQQGEPPQLWCLWHRQQEPTEQALQQVQERYSLATRTARVGVWEWQVQTGAFYLDSNVKAILGYTDAEIPNDLNLWMNYVHPDDREAVMAAAQAHLDGHTPEYVFEHRMLHKDGTIRWILVRGLAIRNSQGEVVRMVGTDTDITDRKRTEILLEIQNRILAKIASSDPLTEILNELMGAIEAQIPGASSSLLFLDASGTLGHGVAPHLPEAYMQLSHGIPIGEGIGSCGTAAFRRQPVISPDIANDPLWRDFKHLPLAYGLRACWSVPMIARDHQVLGTFAVYFPAVRSPQDNELEVIHLAANIARIAVEHHQFKTTLQQKAEQERLITYLMQQIRQSLELKVILQTAVTEVRQLLNIDRVVIYRFNPDWSGKIIVESVLAPWIAVLGSKLHDPCFTNDLIEPYRHGKILQEADIRDSQLNPCYVQFLEQFQIRANLVVPIIHEGELWGLFCVHHCRSPRSWQPNEVELLIHLANQLAIAIQHATTHQQLQEELLTRQQAEHQLQHLNQELEAKVEQRTAELRDSEERFRSLYEELNLFFVQSLEGFFFMMLDEPIQWDDTTDKDATLEYVFTHQRITRINEAMLGQYGATQEQFLGRTPADFFAHDLNQGKSVWRQFFDAGRLHVETHERKLDGTPIFIEGDYICLYNQEGKITGHFGVQRDISDRKQAEQELLQAKAEAETANQAKSIFLANVSHELRTPLNGILGFSQLMEHHADLSPDCREYLKVIHNSGNSLLRLINDILDTSKIEAGKLTLNNQPINLFKQLQSIHQILSERISRKNLYFNLEILSQTPQYIEVDAQKLEQVLMNLLSNAIKFTQHGGIRLRVGPGEQHFPTHPLTLRFEVEDSGIGIAPQDLSLIFEAFAQTTAGQQAQEGTGLGLSISRRLVRLMGGDILVRSTPEQGSTFAFTVPVVPVTEASVSAAAPSTSPVISLIPNHSHYRVLVVDDQAENRLLLVRTLHQIGLHVQEAATGEAALQIWQQWQPHLIWMDIRLPDLDGYEVTRRIRALEAQQQAAGRGHPPITPSPYHPITPPTVIIALTAQALPDDRALALAAGCDDYISKPFQQDALFHKMAEHLGMQITYREERSEVSNDEFVVKRSLTVADLAVMPQEWVAALHKASTLGRDDFVEELLQQIPSEHAALTGKLQELTHAFELESISTISKLCLESIS